MPDPTDRVSAATADPHLTGRRMRASDADRHATVEVLQDAIARGLLTPAEGSDRMSSAYATAYVQDLEAITADLPSSPGGGGAMGWRPLMLMVLERLQLSFRSAMTGRRRRALLGATLLLVLVFMICGLAVAHLVLDYGGGPGHGGMEHH